MTALDLPEGLAAALEYSSARNWPIFPCNSRKVPLIKAFAANATTDLVQLWGWWAKWPWALPALPTGRPSGVVVLDIDVKEPRAYGFDTLETLGLSHLPETPIAITPSGGCHIYFACHPVVEIRNSVGKYGLGPGVDIRGEGGLVVLPGGNSGYSWDPHYNPSTAAFQPAPFWLGHRSRPEKRVELKSGRAFNPQRALHDACDRIRSAEDGHKREILNREAFRIGTLVSADLLRRGDAWNDLEAATAALIRTSTAEPDRTWKFLAIAFNDGLRAPRRVRA
jgi:putative DNA primase/helicase